MRPKHTLRKTRCQYTTTFLKNQVLFLSDKSDQSDQSDKSDKSDQSDPSSLRYAVASKSDQSSLRYAVGSKCLTGFRSAAPWRDDF